MNARQAQKLVNQARAGLATAEQAITKIVQTTAWHALGYPTFAALWQAEFQGQTGIIAKSIRPQLIVALLKDDLDEVDIALALSGTGVGPDTVTSVVRQYGNGVPVGAISTVVRTHTRAKPSAARFIRVEVGEGSYALWSDLAADKGSTLKREAERALSTHFARLAARR